ncbi:MAG: hypothetical protein IKH74_04035, partial [Lachnospiraceae bacterium]|nr:hypothetical protein [Lachnospiraceae bacterium]
PEVRELRDTLLRLGAEKALMTGSGSAVFGVFRDSESLLRAMFSIRERVPFESISPVRTIEFGVEEIDK